MTSDESLDEKLARIGQRIAVKTRHDAEETRRELSAIGALDLAQAAKERFGARLAYLKTPRIERGSPIVNGDDLMRPGCVWTPYAKPKVKKTDG